ncbi:hypothetical protein [Natronorubrum sp. DTA28]|uniref:hypothetical protein n=1 Tax=Natronorubrum sp. DTA28 TaxID=3447019 RepID=UPI003F847D08
MGRRDGYQPNFEAEELPVWYINTEGTIAYHLYPDCGHTKEHSDRELSQRSIPFQSEDVDSLEEWKKKVEGGRHMCSHCLSRFEDDWFKQVI